VTIQSRANRLSAVNFMDRLRICDSFMNSSLYALVI
jgi:hypothetical protein